MLENLILTIKFDPEKTNSNLEENIEKYVNEITFNQLGSLLSRFITFISLFDGDSYNRYDTYHTIQLLKNLSIFIDRIILTRQLWNVLFKYTSEKNIIQDSNTVYAKNDIYYSHMLDFECPLKNVIIYICCIQISDIYGSISFEKLLLNYIITSNPTNALIDPNDLKFHHLAFQSKQVMHVDEHVKQQLEEIKQSTKEEIINLLKIMNESVKNAGEKIRELKKKKQELSNKIDEGHEKSFTTYEDGLRVKKRGNFLYTEEFRKLISESSNIDRKLNSYRPNLYKEYVNSRSNNLYKEQNKDIRNENVAYHNKVWVKWFNWEDLEDMMWNGLNDTNFNSYWTKKIDQIQLKVSNNFINVVCNLSFMIYLIFKTLNENKDEVVGSNRIGNKTEFYKKLVIIYHNWIGDMILKMLNSSQSIAIISRLSNNDLFNETWFIDDKDSQKVITYQVMLKCLHDLNNMKWFIENYNTMKKLATFYSWPFNKFLYNSEYSENDFINLQYEKRHSIYIKTLTGKEHTSLILKNHVNNFNSLIISPSPFLEQLNLINSENGLVYGQDGYCCRLFFNLRYRPIKTITFMNTQIGVSIVRESNQLVLSFSNKDKNILESNLVKFSKIGIQPPQVSEKFQTTIVFLASTMVYQNLNGSIFAVEEHNEKNEYQLLITFIDSNANIKKQWSWIFDQKTSMSKSIRANSESNSLLLFYRLKEENSYRIVHLCEEICYFKDFSFNASQTPLRFVVDENFIYFSVIEKKNIFSKKTKLLKLFLLPSLEFVDKELQTILEDYEDKYLKISQGVIITKKNSSSVIASRKGCKDIEISVPFEELNNCGRTITILDRIKNEKNKILLIKAFKVSTFRFLCSIDKNNIYYPSLYI